MLGFGARLRDPLWLEGGGVAVCVGGSIVRVPLRAFLDDRSFELPSPRCSGEPPEESFNSIVELGVDGSRKEGSSGGRGTFGSGEKCVACEAISAATLSAESKRLCFVEPGAGVTGINSTKGP
jgi:hypothetical protein